MKEPVNTVYPSKIDKELYYGSIGIIVVSCTPILFTESRVSQIIVLITLCVSAIMIITLFHGTKYTINEDSTTLNVKSSFIVNQTIKIENILSIKKTNSLLSAPAVSMDRIEIKQRYGRVIISPVDKKGFIEHILQLNPNIEVDGHLY